MTTSQGDKPEVMLKAVIEKAVRNGWKYVIDGQSYSSNAFTISYDGIDSEGASFSTRYILLDHSFAKAYWGEKKDWHPIFDEKEGKDIAMLNWQYHLQQAVLSENPLLYYFERL